MVQRKSGHVTLLDIAQASGYLRLHRVHRAQRGAAFAERGRHHPRADSQHGAPARLSSRRLRAIAAPPPQRRPSPFWPYDLSDPFCIPIVHGIQAGLQPAGYLPLIVDAQTQRKLFDSSLHMILERRADGVIVIASWIFEETNLLDDVKKNKVPIVIVGRDLTDRDVNSILVDNEAGGALAMRHLIELGHRRIAIIRGPRRLFDSEPRWAGIQRAAAEAGLEIDPKLVFQLPNITDSDIRLRRRSAFRKRDAGRPDVPSPRCLPSTI